MDVASIPESEEGEALTPRERTWREILSRRRKGIGFEKKSEKKGQVSIPRGRTRARPWG